MKVVITVEVLGEWSAFVKSEVVQPEAIQKTNHSDDWQILSSSILN